MIMRKINYLLMNTRKECVICGSENMSELFTLNMPPFMGVVDHPTNDVLNDMDFTECGDCGNVQIKTILPPEIVYQNNHNIGIIGKIWTNHYVEFSKFIEPNIENKVVFEISDPSAAPAFTNPMTGQTTDPTLLGGTGQAALTAVSRAAAAKSGQSNDADGNGQPDATQQQ